jgi:hypothetical protein
LRLARSAHLFHTPAGRCYAAVDVSGHTETHEIRFAGFRKWLVRQFYNKSRKPPSADALQAALSVLEARATYDGPEEPVYVRVAPTPDGGTFLDLGRPTWEVAQITSTGWEIISHPPVHFIRSRGMDPLPIPERGGTLDTLKRFVNVADDDWPLFIAWITAAMRPAGPYPVLTLCGEQGTAKSTTGRFARAVVDPHMSPLRSEPRENRDLMIGASNGWMLAFDNLSHLPVWLSDGLCRLATGGGFSTRELYSDMEEVHFNAQRPVLLTGIDDLVRRGDLMDRGLFLTMAPISEDKRKTEKAILREVLEDAPKLLGALLDAVASGLRLLPQVQLKNLPRMADFALWGEAVCQAVGMRRSAFLDAYAINRRAASETLLEDSPVVPILEEVIKPKGKWEGTSTQLLDALNLRAEPRVVQSRQWPKSPRGLSSALRRLAPALRAHGVDVTFPPRSKTARSITIERQQVTEPE